MIPANHACCPSVESSISCPLPSLPFPLLIVRPTALMGWSDPSILSLSLPPCARRPWDGQARDAQSKRKNTDDGAESFLLHNCSGHATGRFHLFDLPLSPRRSVHAIQHSVSRVSPGQEMKRRGLLLALHHRSSSEPVMDGDHDDANGRRRQRRNMLASRPAGSRRRLRRVGLF